MLGWNYNRACLNTVFCYRLPVLQNLNTTDSSMLPTQPRRTGLRQSTRQLPHQMELEQRLPRSFSKERLPRNFGTNLMNHISHNNHNAMLKPTHKAIGKLVKNPNRYQKQPLYQLQPLPKPLPLSPLTETSWYQQSILYTLKQQQTVSHSQKDFLAYQSQLDDSMRCILIGWLIEVCNEFGLKDDTLVMCVSLVDRFLREEVVPKSRFQLLGVAALFIACKYQEIYPPHVNKFVAISGGGYTKQDVLEMESVILIVLEFKLVSCTSQRFLEMRCLQAGELPLKTKTLAEFILLMAMIDYRMCWHKPSNLALAALCLSAGVFQNRMVEPYEMGIPQDMPIDQFRLCYAQLYEIYVSREAMKFGCLRARMAKNEHYDPMIY